MKWFPLCLRNVEAQKGNLFKICTSWDTVFRESLLYTFSVESQQVDDVCEAGCQTDKLEDFTDFDLGESVDVVNDDYDRLLKFAKRLGNVLFYFLCTAVCTRCSRSTDN